MLVAVFATVNLALEALLVSATQASTLAVAASTLVVFALFQPLRRRSADDLGNRRIIDAFFARSSTLTTRRAAPLSARRLPKHARCQATLLPADFVREHRMIPGGDGARSPPPGVSGPWISPETPSPLRSQVLPISHVPRRDYDYSPSASPRAPNKRSALPGLPTRRPSTCSKPAASTRVTR